MNANLLTWWTFFRVSLEERLVYRGDFAMGTIMRFLPIITQIFLWWAIFDGVQSGDLQSRDANTPPTNELAGYSYHDMVAYFLLAMVARAFSSMPGLTSGIALQIRNGEVKKFLIQPVDLLGCLLLQRIAHKIVYYTVAIFPFAFVFYLCGDFFEEGWPDATTMLAFLATLVMGFFLGFFLEACIGMVGFWFLEITSLTFVYMLLSFFLSGHMFPLDILPTSPFNWHALVDFLPLKYLAYYPAAVFLGKIEGADLAWGLCTEAAWLLFFVVLSRVLWHRGVKRYSGYGG